jgi:hypothetical protein
MPAEPCFKGDRAFGTASDLTLLDQREQNAPVVRNPGGARSINATRHFVVQAQACARNK